jgi:hypothetical protein
MQLYRKGQTDLHHHALRQSARERALVPFDPNPAAVSLGSRFLVPILPAKERPDTSSNERRVPHREEGPIPGTRP